MNLIMVFFMEDVLSVFDKFMLSDKKICFKMRSFDIVYVVNNNFHLIPKKENLEEVVMICVDYLG